MKTMTAVPTLREYFRAQTIAKLMAIAGPVLRNSQQYYDYLAAMSDSELSRDLKDAFEDMDAAPQTEPYKMKTGPAGDYVEVCGTCFPSDTIVNFFPDLAGIKISHSICRNHLRRQLREHYVVNAIVKAKLEPNRDAVVGALEEVAGAL